MSRNAPPQGARNGGPRRRERRVLDEERRGRVACPHGRVRDQPAEERQVRDDALDLGLGERGRESVERLLARLPVRDQLRDHRVVGDADLVALLDAGVDPHARRQP